MAGFTFNISQQTNAETFFNAIIDQMISNDLGSWFHVVGRGTDNLSTWALLESTSEVDAYLGTPGNEDQTYRLFFRGTKSGGSFPGPDNPGVNGILTKVTCFWGTSQQIVSSSTTVPPNVQPNTPSIELWEFDINDFVEMATRLTVTSRGFALAVWALNTVNQTNKNSLLCIQRPVNPSTGLPKQGAGSTSPIFALVRSSTDETQGNFKFSVVREQDVNASSFPVDTATESRSLLYKFTTEWPHPNLFDNFSHVIKFPFGFATTRHLYLDELDLICLVNAAAFVEGQEVKITMYGETDPRTYTTIFGDVKYGELANTRSNPNIIGGGRIGILSAGGGIS